MNTQIEKRNGKLTKREIVRRMSRIALQNGSEKYRTFGFAYLTRRLRFKKISEMISLVSWMAENTHINLHFQGRNVVFEF